MLNIAIISASVRKGRKSHRTALFFKKYLEEKKLASATILDLAKYNFPLFEERLQFLESPSKEALDFAEQIKSADGVIIVTPEYNGGYPASLKNVIDLLYREWRRKPVAISTSSDGVFGGSQVITSIQFSLWKMRAWTVPAMFQVAEVHKTFDENGNPIPGRVNERILEDFINELLWCIEAKERMKDYKI